MLTVFGFERVAVTVEDIWFFEPDPYPGEEGAERGVRVEVRLLRRLPQAGSVYSAYPVHLETALWRADLLESVAAGPGSRDRMHYHPLMADDEPGEREFDPAIRTDPFAWLEGKLVDPEALLRPKLDDLVPYASDLEQWRLALPQILQSARTTMKHVHSGLSAHPPEGWVDPFAPVVGQ
jgi:hypothetical protein